MPPDNNIRAETTPSHKGVLRAYVPSVGLGVILGVAAVPVLGILVFFLLSFWTTDVGSASTAAEFERVLTAIQSPAEAEKLDPAPAVFRFESGEWVAVLARDSHGGRFSGGGTVVVRDSTGAIAWFHGHVCGKGGGPSGTGCRSLSDFYVAVSREYAPLNRPAQPPGE